VNRIATLIASLALAVSPLALAAQDTAAPATIETASGAVLLPVPGWVK